MITKVTPVQELKQIFEQVLLNNTANVTKVAPFSVLSGISYGIANVGQRAMKEIALVESHLFPDSASGSALDTIAQNRGIAPRFGASGSSTYLRLVGAEGTVYRRGVVTFTGNHGVSFELEQDVAIGPQLFTYAKVRSVDSGSSTNVDPLSINRIGSPPVGHSYVINEFAATGGRDAESDFLFRARIKNANNLVARHTIEYLTQVFQNINNNVLRVLYQGSNSLGKTVLAIVTQNGTNLLPSELDTLLAAAEPHFSLIDQRASSSESVNIALKNIEWQPIDISFRVQLNSGVNSDTVRISIQRQISQYLNHQTWTSGDRIEWDDLLQIVKQTSGVKYVPDDYFYPNVDVATDLFKLPRLRGFLMLDQTGSIIIDLNAGLSPIYYPNQPDFAFQQTVLNSL